MTDRLPLRPLSDRIVVTPTPPPTLTPDQIQIIEAWTPDTSGTVVAVGPGRRCEACGYRASMSLAPGDFVLFSEEAGQETLLDGQLYLTMRESDVLAVVTADPVETP